MQHFASLERGIRLRSALSFISSAAVAALAIHTSLKSPLLGLLLLGLVLFTEGPVLLRQMRLRRLLRSGDLAAVLEAYHPALQRLPHPETLGPLTVAAALAAHGLVGRARRALDRAVRGEAWEAALEHRWFVETLLEAFDGDRERAVERAESLERLPLPVTSASLQRRVRGLRAALSALARAFARAGRVGDAELLEREADKNPLVHWAMRYGAAVAYLERGQPAQANRLIANAPKWPIDSAFVSFQEELSALTRSEPSVARP